LPPFLKNLRVLLAADFCPESVICSEIGRQLLEEVVFDAKEGFEDDKLAIAANDPDVDDDVGGSDVSMSTNNEGLLDLIWLKMVI
jgi:hypothetical protein